MAEANTHNPKHDRKFIMMNSNCTGVDPKLVEMFNREWKRLSKKVSMLTRRAALRVVASRCVSLQMLGIHEETGSDLHPRGPGR